METDCGTLSRSKMASDWTGTYTWRVERWTRLKKTKRISPEFDIGGYSWRLIVFPKGNEAKGSRNHISVYLDFLGTSYTPSQMCPNVKFQITAMMSDIFKQEATHTFTTQKHDCGFTQFMPLEEAMNPEHGYIVNDALTLLVNINIQTRNGQGMKSKLETGFVGIKSVEETSLLNPSLQCLFHIRAFRKAVFKLPTLDADDPEDSLSLALQQLFYKLQYQIISAKIKDSIRTFHWDFDDKGLKHNALIIQYEIFDKLRKEDKAGKLNDCISELFMGEYIKYMEYPRIEETRTCRQSFMEIPLDFLECGDIYASLEKFCQVDTMEGVNYNRAASDEVGDSKQFGLFDTFPTVLQLSLKRCYRNTDREVFIRINSHYEFYDELDLDYNDGVLLSENADRTVENKYRLYSVLVHADGPKGGRYIAYIRCQEKWYKFDDEVVTIVSSEEAISGQLGDRDGTANANFSERFESNNKSAAVMLFYIRTSNWKTVMFAAGKAFLPKQIQVRFDKERKEKEKRHIEKKEAHHFVNIMLATELCFVEQIGQRCNFDLASLNSIKHYRIPKKTSFDYFKEMVNKDYGIPNHLQRFWLWSPLKKHSMQVSGPVDTEALQVETVWDLKRFLSLNPSPGFNKTALMTINLFLETPQSDLPGTDGILHSIQQDELMIFVKYYDLELSRLSYVGHMFIKKTCAYYVIFEKAKRMAGLASEEEVIGFEEFKYSSEDICSELVPNHTPEQNLTSQGDSIIIQKVVPNNHYEYPTAWNFLQFLQNNRLINFRPLKNPQDEGFKLDLMKTMTYEQVSTELAKHLQIDDPKKIRFTRHVTSCDKPHLRPMIYNGVESLEQMIWYGSQCPHILYYEILDIQLPYLETLKCIKILYINAKGEKQSKHELRLSKEQKIADLVEALKLELGEEYKDCDMRVMQLSFAKAFIVLDHETIVDRLIEGFAMYLAEVIPEDQKNLKSDEFLVIFCRCKVDDGYVKEIRNSVLGKAKFGETLKKVKLRIQKALDISDEEFSHWRFAFRAHWMHQLEYLRDEEEILAKFPNIATTGRANGKIVGDNSSFIAMVHEDTKG